MQAALSRAVDLACVSDTARLDAELLLCDVLGWDRARLLAWPAHGLSEDQQQRYLELLRVRKLGHPVAHLLGRRDFWTLELEVNSDTLIPRPETETLVEFALSLSLPDDARVLDLGTGSGAIALSLATERTGWQVVAVEQSPGAFQVATRNRDRLGLQQVALVRQGWGQLRPDTAFDLIVSNPPYVEEGSEYLGRGDVRFEPRGALVAGPDGLDAIRELVPRMRDWLRPAGWCVLEHGCTQAGRVRSLLNDAGLQHIGSRQDLAGLDRISFGQLAAS